MAIKLLMHRQLGVLLRPMNFFSSVLFLLVGLTALSVDSASAQVPSRAQVPLAVSDDPFGVLTVEIPLPRDWDGHTPRVIVSDTEERLFYPVVTTQTIEVRESGEVATGGGKIGRPGGIIDRVRGAIQSAGETKKQVPVSIRVTALFRGAADLQVRLQGDINQQIVFAVDRVRDVPHAKLLRLWWSEYTSHATQSLAGDDVPKLVHYYLTSMLSRRLNLPAVDLDPPKDDKPKEKIQPLETLALLAAIEPLREEILEQVMRQPAKIDGELAVPADPTWQSLKMPELKGEVPVEEIATRIPPECFYLRFGTFNNYVWFQELSERFGGDLTQAFFLRGFNYESTKRIERMLAAKLTTVAKMFGDKLVGDMALFGCDLYMNEGASLGAVFHTTSPAILRSAIDSDRRAVLTKNADATLRELTIEGAQVSLLTTPDNRIRSFMMVDGNYVVVTSSEYLVKRYLQVTRGEPSLAATDGFKWARSWMVESNNYSVFAYLSPDFFHQLVSPKYQIELRRRLEAVAHLELAEIASLAAKAEGVAEFDSIESMKSAGLLPAWFDNRADGSKVLRSGDRWIDASRGARGAFLPIADIQLQSVSSQEAEEYARVAKFYQQHWKRMDPILFGIRRFQGDTPGIENVLFEGHIAPFEPTKYGWIAKQLAEPSSVEIKQPADDAASLQMHVRGERPGESYYLFAGVKDMMPPEPEDVQGLLKIVRLLKSMPAYIGAWPKPSLIEHLPFGLGAVMARPDAAGFSKMLGGLWRWQDEQWSLLSFDRSILDRAIPHLGTKQSTDQAQVRFHVDNLQNSQLERWVNNFWWERGWRASHGNALMLDTMHQQLRVPNDQCLDVASRLMDVKLQCPLGGSYLTSDNKSSQEFALWQSTAWKTGSTSPRGKSTPPAEYQAPWIQWFRGAKIEAVQQSSSLSIVGLMQLELPPVPKSVGSDDEQSFLPKLNFDVFSLPLKMFGGSSDSAGSKGDTEKAPPNVRKKF